MRFDRSRAANKLLYKAFLEERFHLLEAAGVGLFATNATDRYEVSKILEDFDVVYVLAAVSHASRSIEPRNGNKKWCITTPKLVFECIKRPSLRLVYLSSSTVYGNFTKETVNEDDHCKPFGVYAVLKHCGEQILKACSEVSDLNYSVIRPSALYGERCISRRVSQVFSRTQSRVCRQSSAALKMRSWTTYIQDVVQGLIRAGFLARMQRRSFQHYFWRGETDLEVEILKDFSEAEFQMVPRESSRDKRDAFQ